MSPPDRQRKGTQLQDVAKRMNSGGRPARMESQGKFERSRCLQRCARSLLRFRGTETESRAETEQTPGKCHSPVRPDVMQNTNLHPVALYAGAGAEGLTGVNTHEQNFLCIHSSNFEPVLERRIGERPTIRNGGGSESDA